MLDRFVHDICGCGAHWNMPDYVPQAVERIRAQVGSEEVILGLSGGVDSAVAAALLHQAIGDQLTCVFVDHGLLRLDEGDAGDGHLRAAPARQGRSAWTPPTSTSRRSRAWPTRRTSARSSAATSSRSSSARRRRCRGRSGSRRARSTRTSSSPRARRPRRRSPSSRTTTSAACRETLHLKLLEPLRELFKDEVRELGVALGLPREMVFRHPFPGPGLGVRILGEVQARVRRAAAPGRRDLHRGAALGDHPRGVSWYDQMAQAFAVFLPVRSVGVMGDGRTYDYVVALRAVQTTDFMTADWAELPLRAARAGVRAASSTRCAASTA